MLVVLKSRGYSRSRSESCDAAPIPASPFNFYLISMIRSDPASEEASFNRRYIYEKPPLLRRRAC